MKEFIIDVKPYKNGALCPYCKRRGKIISTLKESRVWRDIPVCGREVYLTYCPRYLYQY
ncbi:MAG: transposase family protein [bacterium]